MLPVFQRCTMFIFKPEQRLDLGTAGPREESSGREAPSDGPGGSQRQKPGTPGWWRWVLHLVLRSLVLQTGQQVARVTSLCLHKLPEQGGRNVPVPAASKGCTPGFKPADRVVTVPPSASPLMSVAWLQRVANSRRL